MIENGAAICSVFIFQTRINMILRKIKINRSEIQIKKFKFVM